MAAAGELFLGPPERPQDGIDRKHKKYIKRSIESIFIRDLVKAAFGDKPIHQQVGGQNKGDKNQVEPLAARDRSTCWKKYNRKKP